MSCRRVATALLVLSLAGCGGPALLSVEEGTGPHPKLPAPQTSLIPLVNIAPAQPWPEGRRPQPAAGLVVNAYANGLDHPRWLHVLPNGDVLVAETNKPKVPDQGFNLRKWFMSKARAKAGAGGTSADRITLLRDADGDGVAELKTPFLTGLHSPFGMALVGNTLYVANADGVVRFPYRAGDTRIAAPPAKVFDLPSGINHHWTKSLIAGANGKLYATVGSNSNAAENGMAVEAGRAAIWEIDPAAGAGRLFATGLRNPNGMAWEPATGQLWTVVNERDEIGSDLVPDYMTSVRDGAFYGWPYSYFGQNVDERVQPPRPDLVATALKPDYALGPHTASLGLAWGGVATAMPPLLKDGMFIGQHGSWNRTPHSGYKVVFVPFQAGQPSGPPRDVLTGFLSDDGNALGRPVGVVFDARGALLVADDVGNVIWRVAPARAP